MITYFAVDYFISLIDALFTNGIYAFLVIGSIKILLTFIFSLLYKSKF